MNKLTISSSIKVSDILRFEITPFLFGVLFSRIKIIDESFFMGYTFFKVSKALIQYDFEKCANDLVKSYDKASGYKNWTIHYINTKPVKKDQETAVELRFYIENDQNLSLQTFNNAIYKKLMKCEWLYESDLNDHKKSFVRGFTETRGSIDITAKFIAQDYYYDNEIELNRIFVFSNHIGIPVQYLNFNPRETQPNSKEKNTQFRINIFWYAYYIGFINNYKADIFSNAYSRDIDDTYSKDNVIYSLVPIPPMTDNITFSKMLNFFSKKVFKKSLNDSEIEILRKELGFDKGAIGKSSRSQSLKVIFDNMEEDKCASCGATNTHTKTTGRQYFEIHHMISVHNEQKYDNLGNLVKLCPNCHTILKKGRASKNEQIETIKRILINKHEVYNYISDALGDDNIDKISNRIYELLG